jgi:hypothetical protein
MNQCPWDANIHSADQQVAHFLWNALAHVAFATNTLDASCKMFINTEVILADSNEAFT